MLNCTEVNRHLPVKWSPAHYLLECPLYEEGREEMRRNLRQSCGIVNLELQVLLNARKDDTYKDWRTLILDELERFVVKSKRFATDQTH